ncbi:SH3 domain-containing protein [Thalassospira xianhensis]|uniref:SH3b domain-containing protein n=1 Tax=Thalassospira xianhensis MCCC 1A02616 TaxID=1177929 RepID=A0A367UKI1_9PROT|nr:SH3 domain-containing protein [Thalassospira xianhensis]RCK07844.1 hypothetical protein TH5_02125 [Thalassospira xianhensis MCCC 1A02616]
MKHVIQGVTLSAFVFANVLVGLASVAMANGGAIVIRSEPLPPPEPQKLAPLQNAVAPAPKPTEKAKPSVQKVEASPKVGPAPNPKADVFVLDEIRPEIWVASGRGNIRAQPTTRTDIVGKLDSGDKITVLGRVRDSEWFAVEYNNDLAFIHRSVANPTGEIVPDRSEPFIVSENVQSEGIAVNAMAVEEHGSFNPGKQAAACDISF